MGNIVNACVCREKVKIPYDKPYVVMKGQGRKRTIVAWDDHQSIAQSPTFTSMADNIVVKSIHFMVTLLFLLFYYLNVRLNFLLLK